MDKEKKEKESGGKPCAGAGSEVQLTAEEAPAAASPAETSPEETTAVDSGEVSQTAEVVDDGATDSPDMAKMIEEAEARGYLRGRNARIEELMSEPGMYRPLGIEEQAETGLQQVEILSNMRRSVWD